MRTILAGGVGPVVEDVRADATFAPLTSLLPVFGAVFGGLVSGLRKNTIERSHRPNQGIFTSAKSALKVGTLLYAACGGPIAATYAVSQLSLQIHAPVEILVAALVGWVKLGLIFAIPGATWYGGQAVVRHVCLRLVLAANGYLPLRVVTFYELR